MKPILSIIILISLNTYDLRENSYNFKGILCIPLVGWPTNQKLTSIKIFQSEKNTKIKLNAISTDQYKNMFKNTDDLQNLESLFIYQGQQYPQNKNLAFFCEMSTIENSLLDRFLKAIKTIQKASQEILKYMKQFYDCFHSPILMTSAHELKDDDFQSQVQIKMINFQIQGAERYTLQNQIDLQYPYSQIQDGSQFKFQFDKFGDGLPWIESVKRIKGNKIKDQEKTLPGWLYFDQGSRTFRGQVHEEDENINYDITIQFSSDTNQLTDKFIFQIHKKIGVFGLKLIGSISTGGVAQDVSPIKIREKIYALVANYEAGLKIIDVSDPQNPVIVSNISTYGYAYSVRTIIIEMKIYALVADYTSGLQIIDVSDPQNPVLVGSINKGGEDWGVSLIEIGVKIYALVADYHAGLKIIDVSNPQNPVLVGNISCNISQNVTGGEAWGVSSIKIGIKIYALLADYQAGLKIIDVSNPQNPVLVGSINIGGTAYGVSQIKIAVKIYAFVANDKTDLKIIDVSDPYNPLIVGSIRTGGLVSGLSTLEIGVNIYALVANWDAGLKIIDMRDQQNPLLVGSIRTGGFASGVSTLEIGVQNYVLMTDQKTGLNIIQIIKLSIKYRNYFSVLSNIKIVTGGQPRGVSSIEIGVKIYALVANGDAGLKIIDVSDPQNPVPVGNISTGGDAWGVSSINIGVKIYALVTNGNAGLKIIDVCDPQNPILVGNISLVACGVSSINIGVKIYALVANCFYGLQIIEVGDPQNPVLVGSISTGGQPRGVSSIEIGVKIYALMANGDAGLEIIDVSDPQNPVPVGNINTAGEAWGVSSINIGLKIFALVANRYHGLKIIEVSDPQNPVLVHSMITGGTAYGVSQIKIGVKIYALLADYNTVKIIDVSDPYIPIEVDIIMTKSAYAVTTTQIGGIIYTLVADQNEGLQFIQITDNIALYPYITQTIQQQIREYQINLYPINMNTFDAFGGETILLSLSLTTREQYTQYKQLFPLPKWLSTNLEEKIINFVPISIESLEEIRYIHYTFSTKVNSFDLDSISLEKNSDIIIRELIIMGYIDKKLFLTKSFNFDDDLIIDPSFNKQAIKKVLSKYYHEGYFEMTLDDFLELSESPKIKEKELQSQFDSKVGKTKVTQKIDFQFLDKTFTHPDEDPLTYTITQVEKRGVQRKELIGLPNWLTFDKATRRFQGTPGIEDLGEYIITVQASKQFKEVSQNFTISLTNIAPTVKEEIPEEFQSLKLGKKYDYIFSETLFQDLDNDSLNYQAEIIHTPKGQNKQKNELLQTTGDFWMKFDKKTRHFTGKPELIDIFQNKEGYNQIFKINITATDIANASVSKQFDLKVQNQAPIVYNSIKNQIYSAKVLVPFNFIFKEDTFNDKDDNNLNYTAVQTDGKPLPLWLLFLSEERKFEGTPTNFQIIHIKLIATDDAQQRISDEFELNIDISWQYVQFILLTYGGSILAVYTINKYIPYIYECFFKNYYQFRRPEQAQIGKKFHKIIPLIKEDILKGYELWKILKQQTILELNLKIKIIENKSKFQLCAHWREKQKIKNYWFEQKFMIAQKIDKVTLKGALNLIHEAKKILETMKDQNAIINGIIANYLIEKDKITKQIYDQLKKESINFINEDGENIYSPLDWYKAYILINKNNNQLEEEEKIRINEYFLANKLQQLNINDDYNIKLLKYKILSEARGINENSRLQPSKGETIHEYEEKIKIVKAKQEIKAVFGQGLRDQIRRKLTFCKMNQADISTIENIKLPEWLKLQKQENTLILEGIPRKEDEGEIIIQIRDTKDYILREFIIKISDKKEQIIEDLSSIVRFSANSIVNEPSIIKERPFDLHKPIIIEFNRIK